MADKIKTNLSSIQIQNFGDADNSTVGEGLGGLIENEFWQDSFNSVVNEDVQFMEKLLYQFGVVEEKTDKERSKIVQDVMTKRARKPSIVKLKSVATSLTTVRSKILVRLRNLVILRVFEWNFRPKNRFLIIALKTAPKGESERQF